MGGQLFCLRQKRQLKIENGEFKAQDKTHNSKFYILNSDFSVGGGIKVNLSITITIPNRLEYILAGPVLLYRRLRYDCAFRRIPLTQGKFAIVDPDD